MPTDPTSYIPDISSQSQATGGLARSGGNMFNNGDFIVGGGKNTISPYIIGGLALIAFALIWKKTKK